MNHYIHLEPTVKLSRHSYQCLLVLLWHEASEFLVILIYRNKLVKYLHWGINKSTFESLCTSVPMPSNISQLDCLFTISNDKLPVWSFRSGFWGTGHANLQCQHLIHRLHPYSAEKFWEGQLKCSSLALLWVSVSNFIDSKLDLLLWLRQIIIFENNFVAPQFLSSWRQSVFCPDCGLVLCGVFPTVALEGFKCSWFEAFKTQLTDIYKPFSLVHLSAN